MTYPSHAVRGVLERTLGVPIFQEQVMQLAIVAAGFTPGEADRLRRAMAAWRRSGELEQFEQRLLRRHGSSAATSRISRSAFSSRSEASANTVSPKSTRRASRCSYTYRLGSSITSRRRSVARCSTANRWASTRRNSSSLERASTASKYGPQTSIAAIGSPRWSAAQDGRPAVRLGLNCVKRLTVEGGKRLVGARLAGAFVDVPSLAQRAALDAKDLGALASAGALASLASNRHRARWEVAGVEKPTALFGEMRFAEALPMLRRPLEGEDIAADYRHLGLSLGRHPLALLRGRLDAAGARCPHGRGHPNGARVRTAGLVITRQRPSSASGVTFVTLEDETGYVNLVVWDSLAQSARRALLGSQLLGVVGKVQKESGVLHVIAEQLHDHSGLLGALVTRSRDFH